MKKFLIALSLFGLASTAASANFFGSGNNGEWRTGPYGPYWEENSWPEWTPMYWMQEMSDSFNDEGNGFNFNNGFSHGNLPLFGNNHNYGNYGMPMMPYGYNNYQPMPMLPYGAAPMPYYGGGYAMPNMQMPAMPAMPAPIAPAAPVNTAPGPSNNGQSEY